MIKKDYYEALGVERNADAVALKKAYRNMALKHHPDRNPGDHQSEERFKEASEAYEVLSDPEKRRIYDTYGHQGLEGTGFSGFSGVDDIFSSFGDIFEEFFSGFGGTHSGRRSAHRPSRGRDMMHNVVVTFEEAAFGTQKSVKIEKESKCETCEGQGVERGTSKSACAACGGTGKLSHRQGFFVIQSACAKCAGSGVVITHPCKKCKGSGRVLKEKDLNVKIPAGVEDGMRLILRGEGEMGRNGGSPGDMYVVVAVKPHEEFVRHENNIYYKLEIGLVEAALGIELEVPTLYGEAKIAIPAGIQFGDTLKLKGKGVPDVRGGKMGDQIIEVHVKTPKKLTKKQKELLEEFSKESK